MSLKNIININDKRKIEILERIPQILKALESFYHGNRKIYCVNEIYFRNQFDKAYAFYKQFYQDELTKEEKILFNLFLITGDNEEFLEIVNKYNGKIEIISKYYNISKEQTFIRYLVLKNIELYKNNNIKKIKKNN